MPRIDRSAFQGAGVIRLTSTVLSAEEVRMPVFATDGVFFRRFVDSVYEAHAEKWLAFHPEFPLSVEEWRNYAYTALRSRLARVNAEPGYIRTDDDWCVPAIIAHLINGIGLVYNDTPVCNIIPVWNPEYNEYILTRDEWNVVTRKMRVIDADNDKMKAIFVRNLAGDRQGDPDIMNLVPVRDAMGRVQRLHADTPIDGVAAFVYLAADFAPDIYESYTLVTHPMLLPPRFIEANAVSQGYIEFAARSA
jgi:hypothetical protein